MDLDLRTVLQMASLFCFACVGLWMWAVHYGPLSIKGE